MHHARTLTLTATLLLATLVGCDAVEQPSVAVEDTAAPVTSEPLPATPATLLTESEVLQLAEPHFRHHGVRGTDRSTLLLHGPSPTWWIVARTPESPAIVIVMDAVTGEVRELRVPEIMDA